MHVPISQKVEGLWCEISSYYFDVKTRILVDFQVYVSVTLKDFILLVQAAYCKT